ncbi:hypothetical protein HXX76_006239 [Chlamydomonas incerta]|uniref:SET domain-containing protein n=1 Tax=Chlamydomonas incerta TaxID=51695 RepID=A0A835TAE4_CHLIN|nr:hypothetical protein HXX76_006239 [Chlamydomonas incerta]|eukprot:KAG2436714.1 hypothetical protein HXX76_006239 [Chlamydomonas incerta]
MDPLAPLHRSKGSVRGSRTDARTSVLPGTNNDAGGSGNSGNSSSRGAALAAARRLEAEALLRLLTVGGASSSLLVAEGPLGRGLFVASPIAAEQPLFSMPDVNTLIVPDPENDPYSSDEEEVFEEAPAAAGGPAARDQGQGTAAPGAAPGLGQAAMQAEAAGLNWREERGSDLEDGQRSYLDRWQRHHGLWLPAWLQGYMSDSDALPAPARLALWLMWLRRQVQEGGGGGGSAAATGLDGAEGGRGVPFWRAYVRCLPPPELVTCLAVFSEAEAALLQVPAYKRQWRRTRANLSRLLKDVNAAAAADAAGGAAGAAAAGGHSPSPSPCYSLEELSYCYSMAISRCFHLPGRMLLVALADMANHQPLWQASAYPWWHWVEPAASEAPASPAAAAAAASASGDEGFSTRGCFQFRAVRPLAAGDEVCICYSEGANDEQLFDYGFVRQGNPYDRLDLSDGAEGLDPDADADTDAVLGPAGQQQQQLCWPALVAAAGFWARAEDLASDSAAPASSSHSTLDAGSMDRPDAAGLSAAEEQSLLLPRSVGGGENGSSSGLREMIANVAAIVSTAATAAVDADAEAAERLRQQRRRSALLSLPHTAQDAAALRRWGLARAASAAEELRRGLAARVAAQLASQQSRQRPGVAAPPRASASGDLLEAAAAAELAAVDALAARVSDLADGLGSSLADDEAVWAVLSEATGAARQARAVAVAGGSTMSAAAAAPPPAPTPADGSARGRLGAAFQSLFGGGGNGNGGSSSNGNGNGNSSNGAQITPAAATALSAAELLAAAEQHDSARGRTALLARLEYKRLLGEAADVLRTYRQVVAEAAAPRRSPATVRF